ncbi:major pollen allergen Lol p 11-like [Typha latifolia]|uniref:major pollen allergen Lol p 11-like n=1 Tax=Typha latifolia TaxID=4733 RepID=UPI003C2CCF85
MANHHLLPLVASLSLFSALITIANAAPPFAFIIKGRVYCDTCRAGFETSASEYLEGAKVRLECKHFGSGEIIQKGECVTDATGAYELRVEDDHQEEICEVILVDSPRPDCGEVHIGRDRARVSLTRNNGISSAVRYANAVGFLKDEPLLECGLLLQKYALGDSD